LNVFDRPRRATLNVIYPVVGIVNLLMRLVAGRHNAEFMTLPYAPRTH
jgi:hypothetical protein